MCVLIGHTFCESGENMWYQTQMPLMFVMYFQTYGNTAVLLRKTVSKIKNLAILGTTRILYGTFSKYFRPLQKQR